jgi:TolA-binding protein
MKYSVLAVLFTAFVPLSTLYAEPSAFGAGDLTNPEPYGLTSSEKVILENNKKLHNVEVKTNKQDNKVDSIRERIDGLQTVVESLSRKFQENKIALQNLDQSNIQKTQEANEYEQRLSSLSQTNSESIEKLKRVITELSKLIDSINGSYVSKDEFNTLVADINKFKDVVAKELKGSEKLSASSKSSLDSMKTAVVYKEAKKLYNSKNYTKAIEYYSYLIDKNYKPATSHYMIGEMYYYRKNYADAISYFKKSASLYSKASYMPVLMFHTAISMEKTGDTTNAKSFYNALISKFPDASVAKEAKKNLSLIK